MQVLENVDVGAIVYTLIARDPDTNSTENLNFNSLNDIKMFDNNGKEIKTDSFKHFFSVDKINGNVKVSERLNRDLAAEFHIPVEVTDTSADEIQVGRGKLFNFFKLFFYHAGAYYR